MSDKESKFSSLRNTQSGAFFPQAYSIGGQFADGQSADDICSLILEGNLEEADEKRFVNALSFVHELNHLQVFLSSTFGLSAHMHTQMLGSAIAKSDAPVPRQMTTDSGREHLRVASLSMATAYYYLHELGAATDQFYEKDDPSAFFGDEFSIFGYPCTPLGLLRLPTGDLVDKIAAGKALGFVAEYWATRSISEEQERSCRINASSILECLALCAELNVFNRREPEAVSSGDIDLLFEGLGDQYSIVFDIYLDHFGFSASGLTTQLPILLDICLMQDAYVEIGVAPLATNSEGRRYLTPADLLFDVFAAARDMGDLDLSLLQDNTPGSLEKFFKLAQSYQDKICRKLKIRTTREQARIGIRKVDRNIKKQRKSIRARPDPVEASQNPVKLPTLLHRANLEKRLHMDAAILFFCDPHFTALQWEDFNAYVPRVDLKSKCLVEDSPLYPDLLEGPALAHLLTTKSKVCPFQQGKPYFCPSRMQFDKFCSVDTGENTVEICPFYLLASFTSDGNEIGAAQKHGAIIRQL